MRAMLESRAGGILFLGIFGAAWALEAALRLPVRWAFPIFGGTVAEVGTMWMLSARFRKAALSQPESTAEEVAATSRADKWLYWTMGAEGVALFLVGGVLLPSLHQMSYLWPSIALIVGLHFYPLAYGLPLRVYYGTATLMCLAALVTGVGLMTGYLSLVACNVILGIACALVLWGSCAFVIGNVRRILAEATAVG